MVIWDQKIVRYNRVRYKTRKLFVIKRQSSKRKNFSQHLENGRRATHPHPNGFSPAPPPYHSEKFGANIAPSREKNLNECIFSQKNITNSFPNYIV